MKQLTIFQTDPKTGLHNDCVSFPNTKTELTNMVPFSQDQNRS